MEFAFSNVLRDTPLPDLLDEKGILRLLPASAYDAIPAESRMLWCHLHGRYGLPTTETVEWLRTLIDGRPAIEIGSGYGDLAHHLGIHATDNYCQTFPSVKAYYETLGQPVIKYPPWVERLDALEAVRRYRPKVVVAQWVTEWIDPARPAPETGGNMYGVKENILLKEGVTYVMIGNRSVHQHKSILQKKHEEHVLPFLRSRSAKPALDRAWVWTWRR